MSNTHIVLCNGFDRHWAAVTQQQTLKSADHCSPSPSHRWCHNGHAANNSNKSLFGSHMGPLDGAHLSNSIRSICTVLPIVSLMAHSMYCETTDTGLMLPYIEKPSNSSRNNFGKITKKELVMTLRNTELLSSCVSFSFTSSHFPAFLKCYKMGRNLVSTNLH